MKSEERKEYERQWRKEHPEEMKGYSKTYYENNKETVRERNAKWREDNSEQMSQIRKAWKDAHPEKVLEYSRKHEAIRKDDPKTKTRKKEYNKIYWEIPENKERRRANCALRYQENPKPFAIARHSSEMRRVILALTNENPPSKLDLELMYDLMERAILDNLALAADKYPHGIPDAENSKVEFKVGFDRIRGCQFVWNIINGYTSRIRWSPSYDDIETVLQGGINNTRLFNSYKEFVLWRYGLEENNALVNKS